MTNTNPLLKLESFGQSIWIDFIRRGMISSGQLKRLVEDDGITGVTSNPSIFEKAILESQDYDEAIRTLIKHRRNSEEIYQALTIDDIRMVADILRPTYESRNGKDGFVSIEVNPKFAHNTAHTIADARRLWSQVDRPNAMIKVPATLEGLPAIRQLTSEGINVNITLLFGLPRYRKVAEAYLDGLEILQSKGKPINQVASAASFFISRIDVLIDRALDEMIKRSSPQSNTAIQLRGQVAIASAKVAYQIYNEIFNSERAKLLAKAG